MALQEKGSRQAMVTQLDKEIVSDGGSEHRVSRILWRRAAANSRPVVEHDSEIGCKAPGDLAPAVAAFAETRLEDYGGFRARKPPLPRGGGFAIAAAAVSAGPSAQADKQ